LFVAFARRAAICKNMFAIILGHEMACLSWDAVIDEIFSSKRPYVTCVLYFTCTLINCVLKSLWYICKVPWLATHCLRRQRRSGRRHLKATHKPSRKPEKREQPASHANTPVAWFAGIAILAANPCTALLFSAEYLAMPFVMLVAPCVAMLLCFLCVYWLLLSWSVASMGVAIYKRVQSYRIRWSAKQFRKRPLLSLGGIFLVVCIAWCDIAQAARRQLERNASDLCRDVPDVACWVWLWSRLLAKVANLVPARRTRVAAELTIPAKEPFKKMVTRKVTLDSKRKEESRSWL